MKQQKIAFCHDWIYHIGGAEGVFFDLIRKYIAEDCQKIISEDISEDYRIYTLFSDRSSIIIDGKEYNIYTALPRWICNIFVYFTSHSIPILSKVFDYRNLMFWYPILIWLLSRKINKFDPSQVVISNSSCIKNVYISDSKCKKILYLHSPLMYIRNHYDDNFDKLRFPIKQFYRLATRYLRPRDLKIRHYDEIFANSEYTAKLCQDIYGYKDIKILYPRVKIPNFSDALNGRPYQNDYYIYIGRLVRFSKDLDTIIYMFNKLGVKLKIIGSGPDEGYLRSIANDNIEFCGYISDVKQKSDLLCGARGLINLTMESFGIITVEAMLCGLPVFGYNKGGSVELVDKKSGLLVDDKSLDNLLSQFEIFTRTDRDRQYISSKASKFVAEIDEDWR